MLFFPSFLKSRKLSTFDAIHFQFCLSSCARVLVFHTHTHTHTHISNQFATFLIDSGDAVSHLSNVRDKPG